MDIEEGRGDVERRFVMVEHRFDPRKIVRGTATEILDATPHPIRRRYPSFTRRRSAFEELDLPTKMLPAAVRAVNDYPYETADWDLFVAEDRIRWMTKHLGLDIEADEEHLRARVALLGAKVELFPEPDFWEVPDQCAWIEERRLMVGPRPDPRADSGTLAEPLEFGVTTFVDASPEPDDQLLIAASVLEGQVPVRLLKLREPDWVEAAANDLRVLTSQHEVVYLFPGQDPGFFLDLLVHYLDRRGRATRDSLVRIFTRVPRSVFLPG